MFNGVVCGGVRWSGLMQPLAVHVKNKSCPEIELKFLQLTVFMNILDIVQSWNFVLFELIDFYLIRIFSK